MGEGLVLKSLPLHDHPEWLDACADVLNEEWPRSKTARLHILEKSNINLPYCLVILEERDSERWELIGHSRLCMVHGITNACFVESVVIKKTKRGCGLGRRLMEITEEHALSLGYTTLYLTTHDKQHFYKHLGYIYCEPIISLGSGSKLLSSDLMDKLFGKSTKNNCLANNSNVMCGDGIQCSNSVVQDGVTPGKLGCSGTYSANVDISNTLMVVGNPQSAVPLSPKAPSPSPALPTNALPPPPALPTNIPPPPPALPTNKPSPNVPIRMNPNKMYWMKKCLQT